MFRHTIILLFCITFLGCTKNNENPIGESCTVEITHTFKNHYDIPEEELLTGEKPSHEYVKFYLQTIQQYRALEAQGVFLLDHPFDVAPDKNLQYKTEHTQQYGVYYGVVPEGFNISAYKT